MINNRYFKNTVDFSSLVDVPVLYVMLGSMGRKIFPYLQEVRQINDHSIQFLQIVETDNEIVNSNLIHLIKLKEPYDFQVNGRIEAAQYTAKHQMLKAVKETITSIVPLMQQVSYEMPGRIEVNFIVNVQDDCMKHLINLSEEIYKSLSFPFNNDIAFNYFCFTFSEKDYLKPGGGIEKRNLCLDELYKIKRAQEGYVQGDRSAQTNEDWLRMIYVLSNIDHNNKRINGDCENAYRSVAFNTLLQNGYVASLEQGWRGFDSWKYSVNEEKEDSSACLTALGCTQLSLDKDMVEYYIKYIILKYMEDRPCNHEILMKEVFGDLNQFVEIVTREDFERMFPKLDKDVQRVAYNSGLEFTSLSKLTNRTRLERLYTDNLNHYLNRYVKDRFVEKHRELLNDASKDYRERFIDAVRNGKVNPCKISNFNDQIDLIYSKMKKLEESKQQIIAQKNEWLEKEQPLRANGMLFREKRLDALRLSLLTTYLQFEKKIILKDAQIRYLNQQAVEARFLQKIVDEYKLSLETYKTRMKREYQEREKKAPSYLKAGFEAYYSEKTERVLNNQIVELDKADLYHEIAGYLIDPVNNRNTMEACLNTFLEILWKQGDFKDTLSEEIVERLGNRYSNDKDTIFRKCLYSGIAETCVINQAFTNLDSNNPIYCIMGSLKDDFIAFLKRNKEALNTDYRCELQITEQLEKPVVLFMKFNVKKDQLR